MNVRIIIRRHGKTQWVDKGGSDPRDWVYAPGTQVMADEAKSHEYGFLNQLTQVICHKPVFRACLIPTEDISIVREVSTVKRKP